MVFIRINNYQDILIASGKTQFILKSVLFCSILNIVLNYFFILSFDIVGAAISTVLSILSLALILTIKTNQILKTRTNDIFGFANLIQIIIICLFISNLLNFFPSFYGIYDFFWKYSLYIILVYFILFYFKLLDVSLIKSLFNKT